MMAVKNKRNTPERGTGDDLEHLVQLARVPSHSDIVARRRPVVMPTRGGVKDFRPDGSDRQSNKLEAFHEASRVLFTEEHVANKKSLSIAEWKDDKGYAEVKGSCWRWMGRSVCCQLTVWPEEALFLLETGHLELYYHGLPLQIQQGFHLLTQGGLTAMEYQVYSMLVRAGLIVYRSSKRDVVTFDADQSIWKEPGAGSECQLPATSSTEVQSTTKKQIHSPSMFETVSKTTASSKGKAPCRSRVAVKRGRRGSDETVPVVSKKPRSSGSKSRGGLTDSLLVTAARGIMLLLADDAAHGNAKAKDSLQQLMDKRLDIRQDVSVVSPLDATCTGAILSKLRIFPNRLSADVPASLKSRFSISFDVFKYRAQFRKTERGPPDYYVVVAKSSDPPPFLADINLINKAADGVPVKWAMIDSGNVSFYDFMDLQLPTVVSKG